MKYLVFQTHFFGRFAPTNHELLGKRAWVELHPEFAFVPKIKGGEVLPENEKMPFTALFGIPMKEGSVGQSMSDEIRRFFSQSAEGAE